MTISNVHNYRADYPHLESSIYFLQGVVRFLGDKDNTLLEYLLQFLHIL